MSAKFSLRIKGTPPMHRLSNPNNKAEAAVARSNIKKKRKQLDDAILWCQENNVRGHSAVKSGLFPLVKNERTVNKRLDVNYMQKEKFEQAQSILETDSEPQSSRSQDLYVVASPKDVRKGSAAYWKAKFVMAQSIIKEASERSLKLNEIPGLLPIAKVKPKKTVENTRVTQICGSMEGKDVLKVVQSLKKKKEEKILAKTAKDDERRFFTGVSIIVYVVNRNVRLLA